MHKNSKSYYLTKNLCSFFLSGPHLSVALLSSIISLLALINRIPFDGYLLYFFFILLLWTLAQAYNVSKEKLPTSPNNFSAVALGIGFSISMAAIAYNFYPIVRFWLDEQVQLDSALDLNITLTATAADSQQPIFGYAFTYFLSLFFGDSILTTKMLGILPMLLSVYILVSGSAKRFGAPFAICLGLYAVSTPYWHYHLMEGRSIALSLFFLILTLFSLYDYLRDEKKSDFYNLFLSSFLFFNTIGLQSNFLLLTLVLALFSVQLINFKDKKFLKSSIPIILSVLISVPFQLVILDQSARYLNPTSVQVLLNQYIHDWNFQQYNQYFQFFPSHLLNGFFEKTITISLIVLYFRKNIYRYHFILGYLALVALFPVFYDLFFHLKIQWLLQTRYYETWRSAAALTSIFIIHRSFDGLFKYSSKITSAILIIIISAAYHYSRGAKEIYSNEIRHRSDWKTVYSEIKPFALKGNNILYLSNCPPTDNVCYEWSWGEKYWSTPSVIAKLKMNIERDAFDEINQHSVLLIERPWDNPRIEFTTDKINNITVKEIDNFLLIYPTEGHISGHELLKIARDYRSHNHPNYYQPVYLLALIAAKNEDKEELKKNLDILKQLVPAKVLENNYYSISQYYKKLKKKLETL